jgi:hypothetical protein
MIGFIANEHPWESLWIPMAMLNVWRIPLLFFVSGMGVYFATQNRDWKQLLKERGARILVPFIFGIFCIVPIHTYIWQYYYQMELTYNANPGHLWFLGNIFVYVILLLPLIFFLKKNEEGKVVRALRWIFKTPLGLLPVIIAFAAEAWLVNPNPYTLYAGTWHGFFLGLISFFFGFCFVTAGRTFWDMIMKWRWLFLVVATALFTFRLVYFMLNAPAYLQAIESNFWIFTVFGFGSRYLNHSGKTLTYLSQAAYPVYILHMIFLYLGSLLIFPLDIPVQLQFILVLLFTIVGCFGLYELIRRIKILRPLFGLKIN